MFVMTKVKQDNDEVKEIFITNPRFDIDEARRVKAFIRFKLKTATVTKAEAGMEVHDIHTMMKFGRCLSMATINGALYELRIRVAGKEKDSIYVLQPLYKDGDIHLNIADAYSIDKGTVNI